MAPSAGGDFIPVAIPDIGERERRYVGEAVASGWVSSLGAFVERFERGFAEWIGAPHAVCVSNGTDALRIALATVGVGPGDEVVVPALAFVAVPAVVKQLGATPVAADVHPEHWGPDPAAVRRAITPRTKAIVAVHNYGHPADLDPLVAIAREHGVALVEDAAEAHGARYRGRAVGTIGDLGCFSFYGNKILTTGEGGMITTGDAALAERARFLKDHAMSAERRYYHTEVGYNCRMTNLQAALGCAQLEQVGDFLARRAAILERYRDGLADTGLVLNPHLAWAEPVNWMVCAVLPGGDRDERDALLGRLRAAGIDTRPFFVPLAELPPYADVRVEGADGPGAPVAARLGARGFNLPTYPQLTDAAIDRVCAELRGAMAASA